MLRTLATLLVVACGSPQPVAPTTGAAPVGHAPDGAAVRVAIAGERISALTPADASATAWLWPPVVDSHVHLAYWPVADELARNGVLAAVDLAAPERTVGTLGAPLHVLAAGPMLTHVGGYPLDAWGSDGYGIGCGDAACVTSAIARVASRGARVIKLALDDDGLDPALVPAAVAAAHARGLKVAVHALTNASAAVAAAAGVDILAHTPIEPLDDAIVAAWRGRAVISTLAAFGAPSSAIDNLRRLRAAGALVLYGTDLGNLRDAGPSADEVAALRRAGLDDAAIADAMTTAPIAYWGFDVRVAAGAEASFLVLDRDPRRDVTALLAPRGVYLRGRPVRRPAAPVALPAAAPPERAVPRGTAVASSRPRMTKWQTRLVAVLCWLVAIVLAIPFAAMYSEYADLRDGRLVDATVVHVEPYSKQHIRADLRYDGDRTTTIWPTVDEAATFVVGAKTPLLVSRGRAIRPGMLADKKPSPLFVVGAIVALLLGVLVWWLSGRDAKRRAARRDPLDVVVDAARRTRNVRTAAAVLFFVFAPGFAILPVLDTTASLGEAIAMDVLAGLSVIVAITTASMAYRLRDPRRSAIVELIEQRPSEIAWFYVVDYRGRYGARAQEIAICSTAGKRVQLRLVPEDVAPLLTELARRAPHAKRGYDRETERRYKRDPVSLIAA